MSALLRYGVALVLGLGVFWALGGTSGAQTCDLTKNPDGSYPNCARLVFQTQTAIARGTQATLTPTPTFTTIPGAATATVTPTFTFTPTGQAQAGATATSTPIAPNSAIIMGGRGRVVNVRTNGFTILWTTDGEVLGQVNYGASASLGSSAFDTRGQSFSGATHQVDVAGLQAAQPYFFDVVSGGVADTNGGQHYQVKTAPDLPGQQPSQSNVQGVVLNPGGGSPFAGAIVWVDVKDANSQGSPGTSQLLGTLSGSDGRFQINLAPRIADLTTYFSYQSAGDQVELFARAPGSEASTTIDTATTYNGGASPQDARLVLQAVAPTPTVTPAAGLPTATPTLVASATATVPPFPTQPGLGSPTPAPPFPLASVTALPPPFATPTARSAVQLPVQLPPLREMILAQLGLAAETPTPVRIAQAPVAQAPVAQPPVAQAPVTQPGPAYPAVPTSAAPPPAVTIVATLAPSIPFKPPAAPGQPPVAVPPTQVAPPNLGPTPGAPVVRSGPVQLGATTPPLGTPFSRPSNPAPFSGAPAPAAATVLTPVVPTAIPVGAFSGLATMPASVSMLFYGGLLLALAGAGIGIYSVVSGPGWRAR